VRARGGQCDEADADENGDFLILGAVDPGQAEGVPQQPKALPRGSHCSRPAASSPGNSSAVSAIPACLRLPGGRPACLGRRAAAGQPQGGRQVCGEAAGRRRAGGPPEAYTYSPESTAIKAPCEPGKGAGVRGQCTVPGTFAGPARRAILCRCVGWKLAPRPGGFRGGVNTTSRLAQPPVGPGANPDIAPQGPRGAPPGPRRAYGGTEARAGCRPWPPL